MQRTFLIIASSLLAIVAAALYFTARDPVQEAEPVAAVMPAQPEVVQYPVFVLKDMDGNDREFAEFDGRHRLLNFWATWCAPCRREIPLLKEFQAEQSDDGILIIGIAVDFAEDVLRYAEAAEFNYPILIGQEDAMAVAESSGIMFIAMPFTMIVSRNGEYLSAYLGELHRSHLDEISTILTRLDNGEIDTAAAKQALNLL